MTKELKKYLLSLPKEVKIAMLQRAIDERKPAIHMELVMLYTQATLAEGGLLSDEIPAP